MVCPDTVYVPLPFPKAPLPVYVPSDLNVAERLRRVGISIHVPDDVLHWTASQVPIICFSMLSESLLEQEIAKRESAEISTIRNVFVFIASVFS